MGNGSIGGAIIMAICCFGCAITFWAIACYAEKSSKPMNFWSGTVVPPETVSDIPGYNHANAVMWKVYSVPFWMAGLVGCLGFLGKVFSIAAAILLFLACVPGMFFLVARYHRIEKRFIIK